MTRANDVTFPCACHSECIVATHFDDEKDMAGEVELVYWRQGQNARYRWRDRLRAIWRIIRRGTPYEDFIILRQGEAEALGRWLLDEPVAPNGNPVRLRVQFDTNTSTDHAP